MPVSKIKFHMSGRDVKKHGQLTLIRNGHTGN